MSGLKNTEFEKVEPRLVCTRLHGPLDAEEMVAIMDRLAETVGNQPYFLWEVFMSDLEGVTPEARRIAAERLQKLPPRAMALTNCNFSQRILAKLVLTAVSMLGRGSNNQFEFFAESASAREWLKSYAAKMDEIE